ncbi:hypothetical protein A8924_6015 [Saccharopolyspora erythraea NRRL 2338]|uniref:Uncharacterized protein n=2 Tax=Saccharopolyspora erythraea TaxID=1836 RepID=A4FLD3_SACEN|nr:DUF6528 family protein [Saccharopolyspora erythraea]PFG98499.1 hypothetical protein A8924_6015 [Saccharopolyspora erythraea NRRL 2338]QRK88552.1 hypothetical protein JQX30_28440 [Saccharopolyspora erythraea]CAM04858.1 hypothetical protein SACE_5672 [Saccharopolyspora erythraea NRRL 2338]
MGARHPRRKALGLTAVACLTSLIGLSGVAGAAPGTQATDGPIVVTEQASDRILVLEADQAAWDAPRFLWSWKPTRDNGMGEFTGNWGNPDEAKLVERGGRRYLLTTDSKGLAAVVPYPQGTGSYWAADVDARNNPHSIELLPDGNVAVAASTGGWIRVYTASQGPRSTHHAEYPMPGGHGVVWDGERGVLWALGDDHLVVLTIGGTVADPVLTETRKVALPTRHGHDLTPVPGNADLLWVSTGTRVYQYSKSRNAFLDDYPGAGRIDREGVKTVGSDPSTGRVLSTSPQPGHTCTWCTETVQLEQAAGALTLEDAGIYKARWWFATSR